MNNNILDDRRIKLLNFLLLHNQIPETGLFKVNELIASIPTEQYQKLFEQNPEFEEMWKNVDMGQSLTTFLIENGLAREVNGSLQLTIERGRDLRKQGSYGKLLADERFITSEARRVMELEAEADRMAHRQFKINAIIAAGTSIAAIYYLLEILDGFFGIYHFHTR